MTRYRETKDSIFFWGSGYSQWYPSKITDWEGNIFPTAEHFMMYHKARLFNDTDSMSKVFTTDDPKEVKKIGRLIKNFDELLWDCTKEHIVILGNYYKFSQNEDYANLLIKSGSKEIVEASPYDAIWGIGLSAENDDVLDKSKWKGLNLLGKCIMTVRDDYLQIVPPETREQYISLLETEVYRKKY